MKLPKNKTTLSVVYRMDHTDKTEIPIAVFRTPEAADNYAGACAQEMLDRGFLEFSFGVGGVTFYDE